MEGNRRTPVMRPVHSDCLTIVFAVQHVKLLRIFLCFYSVTSTILLKATFSGVKPLPQTTTLDPPLSNRMSIKYIHTYIIIISCMFAVRTGGVFPANVYDASYQTITSLVSGRERCFEVMISAC